MFQGKPLLQRHRLVNTILEEELETIHAFSQKTLTPEQWEKMKMLSFKISTPGKVILHGEHAVVYGKTALAASIDLRTTVNFTELSESNDEIKVHFPEVDCTFLIKIRSFKDYFFAKDSRIEFDVDFRNKVKEYVTANINFTSASQLSSLEAFVYLLVYITIKEQIKLRPFHLQLTTQLTIRAGLGSSASFAVSLAACFLHWSHLQKNVEREFNHTDLEKISAYAFRSEKIMHDSPSGIDNSVCTYGSLIEYRAEEPIFMLHMPKIQILLIDSKVSRNTKDQVKRVEQLRSFCPTIIEPILHSIDCISQMARDVFKKLHEKSEREEVDQQSLYDELKTFIYINQKLLSALTVSHPKLDTICADAQSYSFAAKLTGAGGGGFAYILLPPHKEEKNLEVLIRVLKEKGFNVIETVLGGDGVKIE